MTINTTRIRYDYDYLKKTCTDNNIQLLIDYENDNINRESIIEAKCVIECCNENVKKTFRNIVENGCYCDTHTTENGQQKMKNTCLEKYGVEHPLQNAEVSEKASKNAYKVKNYTFPSGRIEKIQGYENYTLDKLLQEEHILEDDILVSRKDVPNVWYNDINGKKRRYFVDCFIKSQNRCIETKSTWTAQKKKDMIFLKQQALKDDGYKCEIWVYEKGGKIMEIHK